MRRDARSMETKPAEPSRPRRAAVWTPGWSQGYAVGEPIDVSVCIANWNCKELLRGCLRSLLEQPQGVSVEVLVVDNASSDGSADLVAGEFPEVTLVRNGNNRGFAKANNQAAAKARGRFLFFLNNDTVAPPMTLRRLMDFAEAHPEIGMVGPRCASIGPVADFLSSEPFGMGAAAPHADFPLDRVVATSLPAIPPPII